MVSRVIEKIFSIPGMGSVMLDGINAKDYPVAMGSIVLVFPLTRIIDYFNSGLLSYGIIDPRMARIGGRK